MAPRRPTTFTLVELMIVVAIIAVLAAVAIPLLNAYSMKSRRSEVFTLTDALVKQGTAFRLSEADLTSIVSRWPRDEALLDRNLVSWTPAPAGWVQVGFDPGGAVRCTYSVTGTEFSNNAISFVTAEGICDVDDDNALFIRDASGQPSGVNATRAACKAVDNTKCDWGGSCDCF